MPEDTTPAHVHLALIRGIITQLPELERATVEATAHEMRTLFIERGSLAVYAYSLIGLELKTGELWSQSAPAPLPERAEFDLLSTS